LKTNYSSALTNGHLDPTMTFQALQSSGYEGERELAMERVGLAAVHDFIDALCREGIHFCHWKSNVRLEVSLRGETDLDLLVMREDGQRFREILYQHNIKPVLAAPGKRYPAVEDYLGFDPTSGRSFHLHVHYQLVLGEQFVKNYRIPLETQFLESAQPVHGLPIPAPELEIIVLSLRALLKYRDRDAVKDIFKIRYPGVPDHITQEIYHLLEQCTLDDIEQTLAQLGDAVPGDVVLEFLSTIVEEPRAGYRLYQLRQRVRHALNKYQRQNRFQAVLTYLREMWSRRGNFLRFAPQQQMTPVNGGMTLALVGADGAGKSTLSKMLRKWLGWKLDVWSYYLGSKEPSRRSRTLYKVFRMARRSHTELSKVLGESNPLCKTLARVRETILYLYHLSIGHDRFGRYAQGMKKAMAGSIVIFDRFPLESLGSGDNFHLLDGPQITLDDTGDGTRVRGFWAEAFAAAERALYRKMLPPDCLIVLEVDPDVSMQRKPDHERATIEKKSAAINLLAGLESLQSSGVRVIHVDANQPLDMVVSQIKRELWARL
jgi:thymidylate kinase